MDYFNIDWKRSLLLSKNELDLNGFIPQKKDAHKSVFPVITIPGVNESRL